MKKVLVLRHGRAENISNIQDHDRELHADGDFDSKLIGKHIAEINSIPNLVISSSATRAHSTAKNAINAGSWNSKLVIDPSIYGGRPDYLLYLLAEQSEEYKSICLVGHEPNFSAFIALSTDKIYRPLKTANIALIDFNVNNWCDIKFGDGILSWLISPELLK